MKILQIITGGSGSADTTNGPRSPADHVHASHTKKMGSKLMTSADHQMQTKGRFTHNTILLLKARRSSIRSGDVFFKK